jgi:hypothetical protein
MFISWEREKPTKRKRGKKMEIKVTANFSKSEQEILEKASETLESVALVIIKGLQIAEKPIRVWSKFW